MDEDLIPEVPRLPEGIVSAARRGRLITFVGAGISQLCNGPSWDELADNLLEQLILHGVFTYKTVDQLKGLDAKKRISIPLHKTPHKACRTQHAT